MIGSVKPIIQAYRKFNIFTVFRIERHSLVGVSYESFPSRSVESFSIFLQKAYWLEKRNLSTQQESVKFEEELLKNRN